MKKFLITAALLLAGATASFAQLHLGIGYNGELSSATSWVGNTKYRSTDWMNGFYAGASYNIALGGVEGLGLAPGAYFTFAGGHRYDATELLWGYAHHTALEVPIHITYSHDLGPGTIFGYAGPAFNVGLGYKCRYRTWDDEAGRTARVIYNYYKKSNKATDLGIMQRFDCRIGFGVGYRWQALAAEMGWDFGVVNQYSRDYRRLSDGKPKFHTHSFHFGVAYVF